MDHCDTKGGTKSGGRITLKLPEIDGQESNAEGTIGGTRDLRIHLDIGGPEDGTEMVPHIEPMLTQEGEKTVTISTEGEQSMQGKERGEGD